MKLLIVMLSLLVIASCASPGTDNTTNPSNAIESWSFAWDSKTGAQPGYQWYDDARYKVGYIYEVWLSDSFQAWRGIDSEHVVISNGRLTIYTISYTVDSSTATITVFKYK